MLRKDGKLLTEPEGKEDKKCELILAREKLRNSKNTACCLFPYTFSSRQLPMSQSVSVNTCKDSWYPKAPEIAATKCRSGPEDPVGTLAITDNSDGKGKGCNSPVFSHIPDHFSQEDDCHPPTIKSSGYADVYTENWLQQLKFIFTLQQVLLH